MPPEIEKRVEEKLKETRQETREIGREEKMDGYFKDANEGLALLLKSGLDALNVIQLKAVLSVHKEKPAGNKPELRVQVDSLLTKKTPVGGDRSAVLGEMQRLTTVAAAARAVNDQRLALEQAPAPSPALLMGPGE